MPFSNPIVAGDGELVRDSIRSENYVPETSGWSIDRDGHADFANVSMRGELENNGVGATVSISNGTIQINDTTPGDQSETRLELEHLLLRSGDGTLDTSLTHNGPGGNGWSQLSSSKHIVIRNGYLGADRDLIIDDNDGFLKLGNDITPTGWVNITPVAPWVDAVGIEPQYMLMADGTVQYRGRMANGSTVVGTLVFTVPPALRPTLLARFVCAHGGTSTDGILQFQTDGNVVIGRSPGTASLSLDGIRYSIL